MKIDKPDKEVLKKMFRELIDAEFPRDEAYKAIEIVDFCHKYYMEKIEIILAIAGEMQKHFKEGN